MKTTLFAMIHITLVETPLKHFLLLHDLFPWSRWGLLRKFFWRFANLLVPLFLYKTSSQTLEFHIIIIIIISSQPPISSWFCTIFETFVKCINVRHPFGESAGLGKVDWEFRRNVSHPPFRFGKCFTWSHDPQNPSWPSHIQFHPEQIQPLSLIR